MIDINDFMIDTKDFVNELMPEVLNSNLSQEIKDAWCEFAVTLNVGELKEYVNIEVD